MIPAIKKQPDIRAVINKFQKDNVQEHRYCSFDYCYNYFLYHFGSNVKRENDIEKSCLVLGWYLASWGMLRGSSYLLQKSLSYFKPLIKYVSEIPPSVWSIDVDKYSLENRQIICDIYSNIRRILVKHNRGNENPSLTLITKIMLGVFGFVPAFDQFFTTAFREIYNNECGFSSLNNKSLDFINNFYDSNSNTIDSLSESIFTRDFNTGLKTKINYPIAKIIDIYGFTKGLRINKSE